MKLREKILNYFIVLLCLFSSGTPLVSSYFTQVILITIGIVALICIYRKIIFYRRQFLFLTVSIILMIFTMAINLDGEIKKISGYICVMLLAFLAVHTMKKGTFVECYVNIMSAIAVNSLIFYVIGLIYPSFVLLLPKYAMVGTGESYRTVFHIHYYNFHEAAGLKYADFGRNMGPFREPGMFQFMLYIAILFIMFYSNMKHIKIKITLLIIAMLTTFSTTGIVCSLLVVCAFITSRESKQNIWKLSLRKYLFIGIGIIVVFTGVYSWRIFEKLIVRNASVLDRTITTAVDIDLWMRNPILGIGPKLYFSEGIGSNNAITSTLAMFGIVYVGFILIELCCFIGNMTKETGRELTLSNTLIFTGFLIQFYSQAVFFIPMFQVLLYLPSRNQKEKS